MPKRKGKKRKAAKKAGRGPGRPRKKTGRAGSGSRGVPAWIVAVPGRGRSWQTTVYYSREDAVAAANEFLAAGKDAKKIGIYQAIDFQVQTQPTISL